MANDDHAAWSELAAGYAMSSLDDADEATYLQHAASCTTCRELEHDLSVVLADLAHATPAITPPPTLKASIMRAIEEDDSHQRSTIPIDSHRPGHRSDRSGYLRQLSRLGRNVCTRGRSIGAASAQGAGVVVGGGRGGRRRPRLVVVWVTPRHKQASIAARCAAVNCPLITLTGAGQPVGAVMVLNDTVYVDAHGLPPTPAGYVYVLWSLSTGKAPVGLAALHTVPTASPVRAGPLRTPIGSVSGFALSQEHGSSVPPAPSARILASGSRA